MAARLQSSTHQQHATPRTARGFTLMEILVVIVVIGVIVSAATLSFGVLGKDREAEDQSRRFWAVLVQECDELGAVDWKWQSADAWLGKARFGGEKGGQKPHRSWENGHQEVGVGRW